ncbi:hypothetical protein EIA51_07595 [Avibacterium paragallinarum]|nr:hypothetical protein EIA51_07595 [Avibacterium paragallinarum]
MWHLNLPRSSTMSEKDGLFENPNQNEAQTVEEQKRDTLVEIKEDTASIRDILENFGGRQIALLAQAEKQAKSRHLSEKRTNEELIQALKTPKVVDKVRSKNQENLHKVKQKEERNDKSRFDTGHFKERKTHPGKEKLNPVVKARQTKSSKQQTQPILEQNKPPKKKERTENAEVLPNQWQRDKNGRVRDKDGRFVKEAELDEQGIKNPTKSDSEEETQELARENAMVEVLSGIKDAIDTPDNLDPLIDGVKEITGPLGSVFDTTKTVVGATGRGFGKLFGGQDKEQRQHNRFFRFFKKFTKQQEKADNQQNSWLKRIWKKPNGNGVFGRLFGLLRMFARFPFLLARLPFMFATAIGRGLLKMLGGAGKLGAGLLGGIGKLGKGIFGGLGRLGKGALKKIPILGSLLAIGDGIGGLFDDSRDEEGKSNRGKRVGGAVGTLIGGGIGSLLGPVGTIAGAMIGDWIGEKIGAWAADFDWSIIGKKITGAWDASIAWIKDTWDNLSWDSFSAKVSAAWDSTSSWIKTQWDSLDWGSFGEKLNQIWEGVSSWITSVWNELDFSGVWKTTKNIGAKIKDGAVGLGIQAVQGAKNIGSSVKNWAVDKADSAISTISGWLGLNHSTPTENSPQEVEQQLQQVNHSQEENVNAISNTNERVSLSNEYLSLIFTTLNDIFAFLKEKLGGATYINEQVGYPTSSITENGMPVSNSSSVVSFDNKGDAAKARDAYIEIARKNGASEQDIRFALANMARETGDFAHGASENMNYSSAERIMAVHGAKIKKWGGDVNTLVRNPEALANVVYADANGSKLGNTQEGDGWRFRGRGLVQLTGRANYMRYGQMIGEDLVNNPDLVNDPVIAAKVADAYLKDRSYGKDFTRFSAGIIGNVTTNAHGRDALLKGQSKLNSVDKFMNNPVEMTGLSKQYVEKNTDLLSQMKPVSSIDGMVIPKIKQPQDTSKESLKIVEQETAKKATIEQQKVEQSTAQASNSLDPAAQYLTQDVSDRRIAHIVTGGIAQKGRI